jgi:hypothetical protein
MSPPFVSTGETGFVHVDEPAELAMLLPLRI